jgi:hypothetical protein
VFFIQKPPTIARGKTNSIPSAGACFLNISPRVCWGDVSASSGRKVTPSRRSVAVAVGPP